jgi:hypothetical protein
MNNIASRYGIRYASIPIVLEVEIGPQGWARVVDIHRKIVWSLVGYVVMANLVFLTYSSFCRGDDEPCGSREGMVGAFCPAPVEDVQHGP